MLPIFHSGVDEAVLDCQLDDKESRRPESGRNASLPSSLAAYVVRVCRMPKKIRRMHILQYLLLQRAVDPPQKGGSTLEKHMNILEAPTTHLKVDPILPHRN